MAVRMSVIMVVTVVMVVGVPMTSTVTNSYLPELAHFAIHLYLPQLSFNFSLP